jgi:hypothetical protein
VCYANGVETTLAFKTRLIVFKNAGDDFAFAEGGAGADDSHGSGTLKFLTPMHAWGTVWDEAAGEWRGLLGFTLPEYVKFMKAFVKPVERRLEVSFTERRTLILHWGFTAESVESIAQA